MCETALIPNRKKFVPWTVTVARHNNIENNLINTVMYNVEKWPNILYKSCSVHNKDFLKLFGHFSKLCMKEISEINQ